MGSPYADRWLSPPQQRLAPLKRVMSRLNFCSVNFPSVSTTSAKSGVGGGGGAPGRGMKREEKVNIFSHLLKPKTQSISGLIGN